MSDAIKNLQGAIKAAAASGPFALDAAFLTAGLNDPDVQVPADYDKNIKAAFQVPAADFKVGVSPDNVGPVSGDSFKVARASIPFLGSMLSSSATLVFALADGGKLLVVQIQSSPANWTWTSSFQFMGGWPFNQLAVSAAQFIFSTTEGNYPWGDGSGVQVKGGARQNFSSGLAVPDIVKSALVIFGIQQAPSTVKLEGVFDMSTYNGESVIFPACTLKATLQKGLFKVFYLDVSDPSIELQIPAPDSANSNPDGAPQAGPDEDPPDEADDQSPMLSVSAGVGIGEYPPGKSPYTLQVQLSPPLTPTAQATDYFIGLYATGEGTPLTPASIMKLVGGGGSYFSGTPPVLQQFLAFVGLQGLTLAGQLSPSLTLGSASVQIGSQEGTSWTPIPNAPAGLNFTIKGFSLQWAVTNPLDSKISQQSFVFYTTFTLAPSIFKGPDGQGDGVFTVEFTSGLQFSASFDGTASLSNFLYELTNHTVSLPSSINADLSDIRLTVDYNAKSFSFSSGFSVSLAFLEVGGKPIISISDGRVSVAAMTPPQEKAGPKNSTALVKADGADGSKTAWKSSISGLMAVGPLAANVSLAYDQTLTPPRWNLGASLAQPITVQDLIKQFFDPSGTYGFPDFLPGTLTIKTFAIEAVIPSGQGNLATTYAIDTSFSWTFQLGEQTVGIDPAKIALKYDGAKPAGQQFSGSAEGTWVYSAINLKLLFGYKFLTTPQGSNQILFVEWEGFRAEYESGKERITFTLKGWSLGTLIQALVRTLGDPYFTLPSPWDLLNSISLDGLSVSVSLKSNDPNRLSAAYTLSKPLNLGFITITSLVFRRDTDGKVTLAIEGSSPIKNQLGDLMNPAKGQNVQDMPNVPGRGSSYFKVFLLVLGQRVGITGYQTFVSTKEAIEALQKVPSTTGKLNPVNPNADQDDPPKGVPYYNQRNNWLIAGHLGLLQVAGVWTVDLMVVFNDPNLYGLRLALAGPRAGGLANLSIDILYKKITDDIGVFQIDFTFPDIIRNLNFGAVSVTLPNLGVKIYTNGDFFIDIGFPYNLDFRRSFSIAAIIYGVPVLGSGGLYFGKLSNATATQVPKTNQGTFDPVIVFGLGLQLGLGYNFTKGPLSAGFALTVFGIVEGVLAAWHPYDESGREASVTELGLALQSDYYFKLSGTVGVIGLLYGKVDFAIIQAAVNVKFTLSLQITYESYRAIPLVATATVDISVKVKIDLGLFSITISLSFSATVSAKFVIGSDSRAPWDDQPAAAQLLARRAVLLAAGPDAALRRARALRPRPKRVMARAGEVKPALNVLTAPQFTVLAPEGSTSYGAQQGAFVFLFAMDAPDATNAGTNTGDTSFDKLCAAFFPWVIDALGNPDGETVDLAEAAATVVTGEQLETYIHRLADLDQPPLGITDLLGFMQSSFTLNIETPEQAQASGARQALEAGATLFPVFDGLSLSVPDPAGSGSKPITFETYTTATSAYRKTVADIFAEVQAVIEQQNQESAQRLRAAVDDAESMAAVTFTDSFMMIGRQLLQAALDLLDSYAYRLRATDSLGDIIRWANGAGNDLTPDDVAVPNQEHNLSPSIRLSIPDLVYTIQAKDTLAAVAAKYSDPAGSAPRWTTTPAQLIEANRLARILQPDVMFTVQTPDGPVPYLTRPGDSFQQIADTLGISLANLASQSALYGIEGLLSPAQQMAIPAIAYKTAAGATSTDPSPDTLNSVAGQFATTVTNLAAANLEVQGLFSTAAEQGMITLANLRALAVSDLWASIQATDQVAQTAGMVARFLVFGLRLPKEGGLTLSNQFLFPAAQQAYGLYQLTGQEFPTPASITDEYNVTLSRAASSHGVDLSFITFNGAAGTSCDVKLTEAYKRLSIVLDWARTPYAFAPSPSFTALPLSSVAPKGFPINTFSFWSTSDMAGLRSLTDRGAPAAAGSQPQPTWWPLPSSVMNLAQTRQSALASVRTGLPAIIPLMPQFQPQAGSTSPSTNQTEYKDIRSWAWTTRVDFQVKKIPSIAAASLADTGAGSVPQGPASEPSLPNVYEMVGPSTEDGLVLERILSAMDALGEGIVSAVFLLYGQSGSSAPSLVTLSNEEFLAFITQTNLSTEANPERALRMVSAEEEGAPPRGIANTPSEFIKLLWELSVVRSGGYYLFYQVVDGGQGLPASIFDTSGTATLSMVVTFAARGTFSLGNSVLDFVNSFVTTDALDTSREIVQLLSLPTSASSAPLSGSQAETLESVAALYGMGPGRLAEINASKPLVNGRVIPVAGIVRQLQQSDLADPSRTLSNLAAYYSVGAQTPITAQDIQDDNPGVTVKLGAVYYIPTVKYVVAQASTTGAAPGNTFGSMAAYYGLSIDRMAVNAMKVGGLFAQNTVLNIDTQVFDLRSTLGPRNIGMLLERANPGTPVLPPNPTPQQKADYARAYMYSLYNTLSAGFGANVSFNASAWGLPFGPQDQSGGDSAPARASAARIRERRRLRLQAAAEADFEYNQSLGFSEKFAKVNPAPDGGPGLPAKSDNPYIGVGTTAQVALRWQDIFGNTTVTPFENPPSNYTGALNGSAETILYNDLLIGVAAWPNTKASYIYGNANPSPAMRINFALDTLKYDDDREQARRDLGLYTSVYFQLHQDYKGLGVPGVTGNAVSMRVSNSLLASADVELTDEQAGVIRGYVSDCVKYLSSLVNGTPSVDPPQRQLSLPVSLADVAPGNIIELDVSLTFLRQAVLTEPSVAALEQGLQVTSAILPKADGGETVAYVEFATTFEEVFQSSSWYMKVGEGLRQAGETDDSSSQQLWAVRFGKAKDQGIYFEIGPAPSYYAPKPVAQSLENRTVSLIDYSTGETVVSTFTGADQNLWFQTCLDAIDTFLSAEYSSSTFILDKILGTDEPLKDGYLGKVLLAKQSLADNIASTVSPILSTSAEDDSTRWAAGEKFRQQLLDQIGAAYAAGAVTVFGLSNVSGAPPANPVGPPNLYGQTMGGVGAAVNQNYTLSSARIPLGPTTVVEGGVTRTYEPRLAFVFTSKNIEAQSYVPLNLSLNISHLEFDRSSVPGIEGYTQSRWLAFVKGPFNYRLGTKTANIPVVNRALPTPPTMQKQAAERHSDQPATPAELARWDYSFEYQYRAAAGDSVQVTIELNPGSNQLLRAAAVGPDLFQALAQFVSAYPAISRDFAEYLVKIDAEEPDPATVANAEKAVAAFQQYITAVAEAYAGTLAPSALAAQVNAPELVKVCFETALDQTAEGYARTDILNLQINDVKATWDPATKTISNGQVTLPAPVIQIDPANYTAVAVDPPPREVDIAYVYSRRSPASGEEEFLPYGEALKNPLRTVLMGGLDLLAYQSGWSSLYVERNKILFPIEESAEVSTTDYFLFRTPVVKFADTIVPRLVYASFKAGDLHANGESNLKALLDDFFAGLFSGGNGGTSVEVQMSGGYSYVLQAGLPRISLPISMLPPTEAVVNPAPPPAFTGAVARTIDTWMKDQNPTREIQAQVDFILNVFGALSAKQPLLVVNNLFCSVPEE